jgi:prephenate dehydrogenase
VRARNGTDSLSEALTRASELLKDLETDFDTDVDANTRKLEDSLTALERMLNDALLASVPVESLESIKKELKAQFKPYKNHMDAEVYKTMVNNLLLKRLREQHGVPRLSLFYL